MTRYDLTNDNGDKITVVLHDDRQMVITMRYAKPLSEDADVMDMFRMCGWYLEETTDLTPIPFKRKK